MSDHPPYEQPDLSPDDERILDQMWLERAQRQASRPRELHEYQEGKVMPQTVRCWQCGARIAEQDARRVTVKAGSIIDPLGNAIGTTTERVDMCATCARECGPKNIPLNYKMMAWVFVGSLIVGGIAFAIALAFSLADGVRKPF